MGILTQGLMMQVREYHHLVGGFKHFLFFHIWGMIIQTDKLHHFSEG
jgi:hypothetical protein